MTSSVTYHKDVKTQSTVTILKVVKGKKIIYLQSQNITISAWLFLSNTERKHEMTYFNFWVNDCQLTWLYSANLSLQADENKDAVNKHKTRQPVTIKQALKKIFTIILYTVEKEGVSQSEKHRMK